MKTMKNPNTGKMMTEAQTKKFLEGFLEAQKDETKPATKTKKPKVVVSAKVKTPKGEERIKVLLNPLPVYSRKAMEGKTSNIKSGTEVILTEIGNTVRVKRSNSSRTFYTKPKLVEAAV